MRPAPRWPFPLPRLPPATPHRFLDAGMLIGRHDQITFFNLKLAISAAAYPSSERTSSVCSPNNGERVTTVGLSLILIGLPTVRYLPRFGWSTSTTVPDLRKLGSLASSSMDRMGPQGMSCSLSSAMASNLVLVTVQASTVANTSF